MDDLECHGKTSCRVMAVNGLKKHWAGFVI
jgi:hypothetical protein